MILSVHTVVTYRGLRNEKTIDKVTLALSIASFVHTVSAYLFI